MMATVERYPDIGLDATINKMLQTNCPLSSNFDNAFRRLLS